MKDTDYYSKFIEFCNMQEPLLFNISYSLCEYTYEIEYIPFGDDFKYYSKRASSLKYAYYDMIREYEKYCLISNQKSVLER